MKYRKMVEGRFVNRPNRFIAYCEINGQMEKCHVCNTGRCKELLVPDARVFLAESDNPNRATKYDLMVVDKVQEDGSILRVNMDSYAPNRVVGEWLQEGGLYSDMLLVKPEQKYGNSRFDFYFEHGEAEHPKKCFMEVKGVTLEEKGVVRFPDAPTERGVKHVEELCQCMKEGYEAYLVFVVQMSGMKHFEPNNVTHAAFGEALSKAKKAGVQIRAMECEVTEDSLQIVREIPCVIE